MLKFRLEIWNLKGGIVKLDGEWEFYLFQIYFTKFLQIQMILNLASDIQKILYHIIRKWSYKSCSMVSEKLFC